LPCIRTDNKVRPPRFTVAVRNVIKYSRPNILIDFPQATGLNGLNRSAEGNWVGEYIGTTERDVSGGGMGGIARRMLLIFYSIDYSTGVVR